MKRSSTLVFGCLALLALLSNHTFAQSPGGVNSNLRGWYKAGAGVFNDAGITSAANGDNVQRWNDQSAVVNHLNQITLANKPVLTTNSINGNTALTFSSNQFLDMGVAPGITAGMSYFVVVRPTAFTAGGIGDANGSFIIDRTTGSNALTSFKVVSTNRYGFQKRNDNATGLTGPISTTLVTNNQVILADFYRNPTVEYGLNINGRTESVIADDNGVLTAPVLRIGRHTSTANGGLTGQLAEVIFYAANLSSTDRLKINSYLAVKYGISLDQTSPQDYLASNGTVLWNGTTLAGYGNSITGIGRDDGSALDQRDSKSAVAGSVMRLAKGSAFSSNLDFIIAGDDNATLAPTTTGIHPSYPMRITRVWRADTNGAPGTISISFDLGTGIYNSGIASDYALLIKNSNADFSAGATAHTTGASIVANVLTFTNVAFADGDYFSLALPLVPSPGGIVDGLRVWLKAGAGVFTDAGVTPATDGGTISQWSDQSVYANHAVATGSPVYNTTTNLINNNPTVYYNGTNGHNLNYSGSGQYSLFAVAKPDGTLNRRFFSSRTGNALLGYWNGREDVLYLDNAPSLLTGQPTTTNPRLYSLTRSASGAYQMFRNGASLYSGAASANSFWRMGIANGGNYPGESSAAYIPEFIQFDRDLTATELTKVQTYLAIKYGFTIDQTSPQNYVSASGITVWDATAHAVYKNNITGIGRDDRSALDQRISASINATGSVTITKPGAFGNDQSFIVFGDNGLSGTSLNVPVAYVARSGRVFKADATGVPGTVSLSVNLSTLGFPNTGTATDYVLLIDADGDFSAGATLHTTGLSLVGSSLSFSNVTLPDNTYFTIAASNIQIPGGVGGALSVWLKGNDGLEEAPNDPAENGDAITSWLDKSGSGNHYTAAAGPTRLDDGINFNAVPEILAGGFDAPTTAALGNDWTLFFVAQKLPSDNNGRLFEGATGNFLWGYWGTFTQSIFLNGNPNNNNSGIATNIGIENVRLNSYVRESAGGTLEARSNGTSLTTFGSSNSANGIRIDINQGATVASESSHSRVGEVLIYNGALSAAEVSRIESYLSIKYGITKSGNYLASDGTVIWNSATLAGYLNGIAGIGRDDVSGLDQRKSTSSVAATSTLTMEKSGAFATNKNFILWGDNNQVGTSANVAAGYRARTNRVWRTATTGAPGVVAVSIDVVRAGFVVTSSAAHYALLIDADGDFSSGATVHTTGATLVGNTIAFTGVTIPDGAYISLANNALALPGGVAGSVFWVKADAGVTGVADVSQWSDQSGSNNHAVQNNAALQPELLSGSINYNPSILFINNEYFSLTTPPANLNATIFAAGSPGVNTAWRTMFRGAVGDHPIIIQSGGTGLGYYDNDNVGYKSGGFTWLQDEVGIVGAELRAGDVNFRKNGAQGASINTITLTGLNLNNFGNFQGGGQPFGRIGETVIFSSATPLTAQEKEQVETYLAIKYGTTLTHNYIATNGSLLWDVTAKASHSNNMAGIGRDDLTGLDQRKSKSVIARSVVIMEKGSFASDRDYVIWGSTKALLTPTVTGAHPGYPYRVGRTWRAGIGGTPGTVSVTFDLGDGIYNSGNAADYALLIKSGDDNFSAGALAHTTGATIVGSLLTFTNVTFADGDFFTLGMPTPPAPGGIVEGLHFWLRADQGVTGAGTASAWNDQSGNGFNVIQNTVGNQPTILPAQLNNNPALQFDGSNDHFALTGGILGTNTYSNAYAFVVSRANGVSNSSIFFELAQGNQQFNIHLPWGNSLVYWDAGNHTGVNRITTAWGGTTGLPSQWSFTGSTLTTPTGARQDIYRNGQRIANDLTMVDYVGNNGNMTIGSRTLTSDYFNGEISEIVFYSGNLTGIEFQKIQSYLSLKYGTTLNQFTPADYLSSAGTSIYRTTTAQSSYVRDIAGIGRDDASRLDQRKSKSTNNAIADIISIAKDDFTTPAAFTVDQEFLVWGHNGLALSSNIIMAPYSHNSQLIARQLSRVWSTEKTGTPGGNAIIEVDLNLVYGPTGLGTNATADVRLLVDNDATFGNASAGERAYVVSSVSGGKAYFAVPFADIPAGQGFFTVGSVNAVTATLFFPAPGGISADLRLWLKANDGVVGGPDVNTWNDRSPFAFSATQGTVANQPSFLTARLNNNPAVYFDGTNDDLRIATGILKTNTYSDVYVYSVARTLQVKNAKLFVEQNLAGNYFGGYIPWGNANVYWDAGAWDANNRLNGVWDGTINTPYLWTFGGSTTATPTGVLQEVQRNARRILNDNTMSPFSGNNNNYILGSENGSNFFNGEVSEHIVVTSALNQVDQQRVHTYLAIKYGITLDQATPQDYFSSINSVIYHSTTSHAGYRSDIAGIGRDDNSVLDQRKSSSTNTPLDVITIANGDFATPTPFASSLDYLVWGNNALPVSADASFAGYTHNGASIVRQVARVWSTDKTNSPAGNAIVEVDMDLIGGPSGLGSNANANVRLLIDGDAAFGNASAGEVTISPTAGFSATGGKIYFSVPYANIPSGQGFFTIGSTNAVTTPLAVALPGGVAATLKLWLKANSGVTGVTNASAWLDQSTNAFNAVQATAGSQPAITANAINFNTGITFDGTDDQMQITSGILGNTVYTETQAFVVNTVGLVPKNQSAFWEYTAGGGVNRLNVHIPEGTNIRWDPGSSASRISAVWGGTVNTPYVWTFNSSTNATISGNKSDIYRNAQLLASGNTLASYTGNYSNMFIGSIGNNYYHQGAIGEIILYSSALTAVQQQRIHSYLGIKYGITLSQTTPQNYLASNGTVIYDAVATHSGYRNDIAGIGRDDASGLDQRRSQSVNTRSAVQMDKGGAFAADRDFVVWGSNGNPLTYTTANTPALFPIRLSRIWRVDLTGAPGIVSVSFDLSPGVIRNSGAAGDYRLVIKNSNTDFSSGATSLAGSLTGNTLSFSNVTFADGDYFTLVMTSFPAPGGVVDNMKYWIKADAGVTGVANASAWEDQSGNAFTVAQATGANQPTILSSRINFNPALQFDGNDQLLLTGGIMGTATYNDLHVFGVSRANTVSNSSIFFENMAAGGRINAHIPWSDNRVYWDAGSTNGTQRLQTLWGGAAGINYLWSLTSSTTATPAGTLQDIYRNGFRIATDNTMASFTGNNSIFSIGSTNGANYFNGEIGELIMYTGVMPLNQFQRVQSYMAVRYGLTLDQTAPQSYYASNWNGVTGTLIWDATTAGVFRTDIAAIGRDDEGALNQKQSASVNATNLLVIGNGSIAADNASNGNNFAVNRSFFSWAHNNLAAAGLGVTDFGTTVNAEIIATRFARTWRAQETGTVGSVKVRFNLSTIGGVGGVLGANDLNNVRLLVDADGTFATGATSIAPTTFDNTTDIVEFDHNFVAGTGFFFTLGSVNISTAPLPVELISFTAKSGERDVTLLWRTASERNNDFFDVEASSDGKTWNVLGRVKGNGTTQDVHDYSFVDNQPFLGNNYYRLRQVDYDKKENYSHTIVVKFASRVLRVYPNPVEGAELHVIVGSPYSGKLRVSVLSLQGVEVFASELNNDEPHKQEVIIKMDDLASGIYFVVLQAGDQFIREKIAKP
ncbi:MAG: T9SS type A sorting domain-containing protein [Cyclobacteriaceae bacterium]|nr:T9SS type A sorting domain-containing protein [Cyclobacteriaceae bacterium]